MTDQTLVAPLTQKDVSAVVLLIGPVAALSSARPEHVVPRGAVKVSTESKAPR